MNHKERLKDIEECNNENFYIDNPNSEPKEDISYLVARVKVLTVALEIIADRTFAIDIDHDDFTPDAYLAQIALSDGEGEK